MLQPRLHPHPQSPPPAPTREAFKQGPDDTVWDPSRGTVTQGRRMDSGLPVQCAAGVRLELGRPVGCVLKHTARCRHAAQCSMQAATAAASPLGAAAAAPWPTAGFRPASWNACPTLAQRLAGLRWREAV